MPLGSRRTRITDAIRFGDKLAAAAPNVSTVSELAEAFLARHRVDEATLRTLGFRLNHAVAAFGERRIETLQPIDAVWSLLRRLRSDSCINVCGLSVDLAPA